MVELRELTTETREKLLLFNGVPPMPVRDILALSLEVELVVRGERGKGMSYLWSFYSFSQEKFDGLCRNREELTRALKAEFEAEEAFEQAAQQRGESKGILGRFLSRLRGSASKPLKQPLSGGDRVLENIRSRGLSYEGLTDEGVDVLHGMIQLLFSPDSSMREELDIVPESPDGAHSSVFEELISRAPAGVALTILPLFVQGGRQFGKTHGQRCEYCILTPQEVLTAKQEFDACFSSKAPWSKEYLGDLLKECVGDVFAAVSDRGRPLFCSLG